MIARMKKSLHCPGLPVYEVVRDDETPLRSAARDGATDAVDWLLKNTTIDVAKRPRT